MTEFKKAPFNIKKAFSVEEVAAEMGGPDESYLHQFNGHILVAPWWADTVVVDQNNMLRVFPGVPYRKVEDTGKWEWRSTDCNEFQSGGIVIGEVEVNPLAGYKAFDGVILSLNLLPFKEAEE